MGLGEVEEEGGADGPTMRYAVITRTNEHVNSATEDLATNILKSPWSLCSM